MGQRSFRSKVTWVKVSLKLILSAGGLTPMSSFTFWAHLCILHGGLICIAFCPSVRKKKVLGLHWPNCFFRGPLGEIFFSVPPNNFCFCFFVLHHSPLMVDPTCMWSECITIIGSSLDIDTIISPIPKQLHRGRAETAYRQPCPSCSRQHFLVNVFCLCFAWYLA